MEKRTIHDLTMDVHLIPSYVTADVLKRILDWTLSGGSYEDDYVMHQIEYAYRFIEDDVKC